MNVDRYRPDDRADVDALFRRVFGDAQADASADRWDWQYLRNPNAREPQIWIARDAGTIVGHYAAMPVRLAVAGQEIDASWGMDVMVAPERQRQGLGELLFQTWDRDTGASLGMGLSGGSHSLFRKLKWPDVGPVPCLVKPLSSRAFVRPGRSDAMNRAVSLLTAAAVPLLRARGPIDSDVRHVDHFDERFTDLWQRIAPKFDLAVRRDAGYLEWKYVEFPHVRYSIVALEFDRRVHGYAVFRHAHEARGRVTMLIDLLADPDDTRTIARLLRFVERDAQHANSDKIRAFVMNAAFRRAMHVRGYFRVASTVQLVVKVNAVTLGPAFYADTGRWHVTFGDSDQDRRCLI